MKNTLSSMLLMAASSLVLFSCSNSNTFKIEGTCSEEIPDSAYYIYVEEDGMNISDNPVPVDSIYVDGSGKFSWSTDKYAEAHAIFLQAVFKGTKQRGDYVDFVLCPGETARLKVMNGNFELDGSKFYQEWKSFEDSIRIFENQMQPYREKEAALRDKIMSSGLDANGMPLDTALMSEYQKVAAPIEEIYARIQTLPERFIEANPDAEGDIACLLKYGYSFTDSIFVICPKAANGRMKKLITSSIEFMRTARDKETAHEELMAKAVEATAEGKMFTDFECEYNGKIQKLSDYVGKGKYILVDFWASWCGPCRAEIPNIINVYNKYKGDKFDVLGVAAWDQPENSLKAIEEEKIEYPQILNSQNAGTDAYGIDGIPTIILFGPDGTILKRDLRGIGIEDAVKEALAK